jgi:predicted transcriptional regulator
MKKSIPPELHAWVLAKAGEGKTGDEIAELLWREHKVETTGRSVRKLLESYRTERADVSKGIIRDELRKRLVADLDALQDLHQRARKMERLAVKRSAQLHAEHPQHPQALKELVLALKAMKEQLRAINLTLHYSGAGEPDQPPLLGKPQKDALLQRLERLISVESAPEPAPGPKDEPPVH